MSDVLINLHPECCTGGSGKFHSLISFAGAITQFNQIVAKGGVLMINFIPHGTIDVSRNHVSNMPFLFSRYTKSRVHCGNPTTRLVD